MGNRKENRKKPSSTREFIGEIMFIIIFFFLLFCLAIFDNISNQPDKYSDKLTSYVNKNEEMISILKNVKYNEIIIETNEKENKCIEYSIEYIYCSVIDTDVISYPKSRFDEKINKIKLLKEIDKWTVYINEEEFLDNTFQDFKKKIDKALKMIKRENKETEEYKGKWKESWKE